MSKTLDIFADKGRKETFIELYRVAGCVVQKKY